MKRRKCIRIIFILVVLDFLLGIVFLAYFHSATGRESTQEDSLLSKSIHELSVEFYNNLSKKRGLNNISCAIQTIGNLVDEDKKDVELEDVNRKYYYVKNGGHYKPRGCSPIQSVAVIIPYRNRKQHLVRLLHILHGMLQRQILEYGIFVVDLAEMTTFNRALTLNIGFMEALKEKTYDCFVFHDVDLIPENDNNMYACSDIGPVHKSVGIREWDYKLPYKNLFGGVVAMTRHQFQQVNGFSNRFFGWGAEDDDMFRRISANNMTVLRPDASVAKYHMLGHKRNIPNKYRFLVLQNNEFTAGNDGLNSLNYSVLKMVRHKLFTYIVTDIDPSFSSYVVDYNLLPKTMPNLPLEKSNNPFQFFANKVFHIVIKLTQNIFYIH